MTAAAALVAADDRRWSSSGLGRRDGIRQWQDWAARTIAPIDVAVHENQAFAAGWHSYGMGQLRLLHLLAPAQRVVHRGTGSSGSAAPSIQLVYARRGEMETRIAGEHFLLRRGEFVLLDNTRFYQMDMDAPHEALDLMMPRAWLTRWVPDPDALLAQPFATASGWGAPLGSLLEAMATGLGEAPWPRQVLADQVGALLGLATADARRAAGTQAAPLIERIMHRIAADYADPELSSHGVAAALGVSTRYLQILLAARGTSFGREVSERRLARAAELLCDPRMIGHSITEIGFRCGFLDPAYFARQFRKRFASSPREWRARKA